MSRASPGAGSQRATPWHWRALRTIEHESKTEPRAKASAIPDELATADPLLQERDAERPASAGLVATSGTTTVTAPWVQARRYPIVATAPIT